MVIFITLSCCMLLLLLLTTYLSCLLLSQIFLNILRTKETHPKISSCQIRLQGTVKLKKYDFNMQMKIFYNFMLLVVHMAYKSGLAYKRLYNYIRNFNCENVFVLSILVTAIVIQLVTVSFQIDGIIYRNNSLMAK